MDLPRIFVCGTGRSGTWILYKALGCHTAIHTFPKEMRFLVDPDGLLDLIDALTVRYHPVQASEALYRFERLLRVYYANPDRSPYLGFDFPGWLGGEFYWEQVDQFCSTLVDFEYNGKSWQVESEHEGRLVAYAKRLQGLRYSLEKKPFMPYRVTLPRNKLKVVKYFPDRNELVADAAQFVDDLFLNAARMSGKETWCEKTPQNLLSLEFLWELFPQSIVVHIVRDPRGVAYSLTRQKWAPSDLEGASLMLRSVYSRWFDLKRTIDFSQHRYYEIKLEDFASSPRNLLSDFASFCGIDDQFINLPDIRSDRVDYWKNVMNGQEIQLVNRILGAYITQLGYEI